jgi:hypothetical protein
VVESFLDAYHGDYAKLFMDYVDEFFEPTDEQYCSKLVEIIVRHGQVQDAG